MKESKTKIYNNNDKEVRRVAEYLEESIKWLCESQEGCCTYKMDDHLAICVGWSSGYGEKPRNDVIQATDDLDFAINAGIKVWTSDSAMLTDFDWINYPYLEDGTVLDMGMSLARNDDLEVIAATLLRWYDDLKDEEFNDDGKIIGDVQDSDR